MHPSFNSSAAALALVLTFAVACTQAVPSAGARTRAASSAEARTPAPSAEARMQELGPENTALARRVGTWDVRLTSWASPGAPPTTTRMVAERRMVGPFLQEIITFPSGPAGARAQRIDYLSFNRVEGRWKYVSMDTRAAVGLMPAKSFGPGEPGRVTVVFDPFAVAGPGSEVSGRMLSMDQVIIDGGPDRDSKEQRFMLADGTGRTWLADRFEYARRR